MGKRRQTTEENLRRVALHEELSRAIGKQDWATAHKLLTSGITVAEFNTMVPSLLGEAWSANLTDEKARTTILRFLLDNGANVHKLMPTVFAYASNSRDNLPALLALLIKAGANIDAQDGFYGHTLLMRAASGGNVKLVRFLVDKGASLTHRTQNGHTVLRCAIEGGSEEVVRLLLDKGADVNYRSTWNATPLHWAVETRRINLVRLLLQRGADMNARDASGKTPLWWAEQSEDTELIRVFQEHGAKK